MEGNAANPDARRGKAGRKTATEDTSNLLFSQADAATDLLIFHVRSYRSIPTAAAITVDATATAATGIGSAASERHSGLNCEPNAKDSKQEPELQPQQLERILPTAFQQRQICEPRRRRLRHLPAATQRRNPEKVLQLGTQTSGAASSFA